MNGAEASAKTNSKLDTFLKKNLDPATFEQLRYNESCIVVGERYDKVFSYVVLGHEWIYITENPPKNVKEEVHYRDVTGIELRNDFPDFLGGQERSNTLHAVVTYKTRVRQRNLTKTVSNVPVRPTSPNPVKKSASAPDVKNWPRPKSASPSMERRRLVTTPTPDPEQDFLTGLNGVCSSSSESLNSLSKSDVGVVSSTKEWAPPSSPRPSSRNSVTAPLTHRDSKNSIELPVSDVTPSSPRPPRSPRGSVDNDKGSASQSPHQSGVHKDGVLHLYMLKSDSPVINHLTNAWNNYLLRGTLICDFEYDLRTTQQKKSPQERLASLFDQLTHEAMLPDNNMEDVFSLIHELKTATEKNFLLKKFFWKYGDLFYFTVDYIKRYIPGSSTADPSSADRSTRADELELVNLMLEMLSLQFREADVLPQRARCLLQTKGRHLADLVVLCTSTPRLPVPYHVPSRRASELLQQLEADKRRNSINEELSQLSVEYTRLSCTVVYELLLFAKQDIYCSPTFVNVGWLVRKIHDARNVDSFVERIFTEAMKLISPSCREQLSAADAVLLYQLLYVLKVLIEHCPSVLTLLRDNFMEEFKYYIQGPVLWTKLPTTFPITKPAITILEKIMSKVLSKETRLSVPEVRIS